MNLTTDNIAIVILVGIVALDKLLGMLKNRGIDLAKMSRQIENLDELHSVKDQDGVPVWYFRRSFDEVLHKLLEMLESMDRRQEIEAKSAEKRDKVMERLVNSMSKMEP